MQVFNIAFKFYLIIIKTIKKEFINFRLIENYFEIIKFCKKLNKYFIYNYFEQNFKF